MTTLSIVDVYEMTGLKLTKTKGVTFAGPCPFCGEGDDRFVLWTKTNRFWCRVCGESGDAAWLAHMVLDMPYPKASEFVGKDVALQQKSGRISRPSLPRRNNATSPSHEPAKDILPRDGRWMQRATDLTRKSQERLWLPEGQKALSYVRQRGFSDETIKTFSLGYNANERYEPADLWGIDDDKPVWLPRGITIPWIHDVPIKDCLWDVRIRRPVKTGETPKYVSLKQAGNGLFNQPRLWPGLPGILVESELDAMMIWQTAQTVITPVATGGTGRGRPIQWLARMAALPFVLIAFDSDDPGETASRWWLEKLQNAIRWQPTRHDICDMAEAGDSIRDWVNRGIDVACAG